MESWSSNWTTTRLPSMPNLQLTGRTLEFLLKWAPRGVQTLKELQFMTTASSSEREVEVCPEKCLIMASFSAPLFSPSLSSHLFKTLTSFVTSVNLLLSVSCYCCLRNGAAGRSNKGCMGSLGPEGFSLSHQHCPPKNCVRMLRAKQNLKLESDDLM